jgi:hypothetical protein
MYQGDPLIAVGTVLASLSLLQCRAGGKAKVRHLLSREWESLEEVLAGHSASRALLGHWQVMEGARWELDLAKAALATWEASVRPDVPVRTRKSRLPHAYRVRQTSKQFLLSIRGKIPLWVHLSTLKARFVPRTQFPTCCGTCQFQHVVAHAVLHMSSSY